jgi:Na+-translocating ferredoxin:NAD+ oxidoreductase RnfD subunit
MKKNLFFKSLQTSKIFRFSLEIIISIIFFSWLPLIQQLIAVLLVSLLCEIIFAKIMTKNLKNNFSSKDLSEVLVKSKEG